LHPLLCEGLAHAGGEASLRSPRTRTTALTVIGMVPKVDRISALETIGREVVPAVGSSLTYVSAPFLLAVRKLAHRHSYQNMESSMSSNMSSEVHRWPRLVRRKRASYLRLNSSGAQVLREICALVPV
jgi:hypothetical protein